MRITCTFGGPLILVLGLALTACATPQKQLYPWGSYQAALYEYLKGNGVDPGSHITRLEAEAQKNAALGLVSPPGLHGHLALLYAKVGDDASAVSHLEIERKLFPESASYIDFLLKNAGKSTPQAVKAPA